MRESLPGRHDDGRWRYWRMSNGTEAGTRDRLYDYEREDEDEDGDEVGQSSPIRARIGRRVVNEW